MKSALNLRLFSSFSLSFFRVCFFSGEEDGRGNKSRRKEERNNSWHQHSGRRKPIAPNSSNQVLQRKFSLLLNFCIHCISASLPPAKSSHSIQQFPLILKNNNSCFNHTTIRNARRWLCSECADGGRRLDEKNCTATQWLFDFLLNFRHSSETPQAKGITEAKGKK